MDPAALIPNSRVAADLLRVARSLRLVRAGAGEGAVFALPDGRQMINDTPAPDVLSSDFPIIRRSAFTIELPGLVVDFHDWFSVASETVGSLPQTGDYWLRMGIGAQATQAEALNPTDAPVDVTIFPPGTPAEPVWEWHDTALGRPSFEAGIPANSPRMYYWYLVHVIDSAIVGLADSTLLYGHPPQIFV